MIRRRNLRTRSIKMLVLDEADEMLNKGNERHWMLISIRLRPGINPCVMFLPEDEGDGKVLYWDETDVKYLASAGIRGFHIHQRLQTKGVVKFRIFQTINKMLVLLFWQLSTEMGILLYTVYSRYIAVVGVQRMVPRYKWERDISGGCQKSTSCSLFQRDMSDNGGFACVATNSTCRQRVVWSFIEIQRCITKLRNTMFKPR